MSGEGSSCEVTAEAQEVEAVGSSGDVPERNAKANHQHKHRLIHPERGREQHEPLQESHTEKDLVRQEERDPCQNTTQIQIHTEMERERRREEGAGRGSNEDQERGVFEVLCPCSEGSLVCLFPKLRLTLC